MAMFIKMARDRFYRYVHRAKRMREKRWKRTEEFLSRKRAKFDAKAEKLAGFLREINAGSEQQIDEFLERLGEFVPDVSKRANIRHREYESKALKDRSDLELLLNELTSKRMRNAMDRLEDRIDLIVAMSGEKKEFFEGELTPNFDSLRMLAFQFLKLIHLEKSHLDETQPQRGPATTHVPTVWIQMMAACWETAFRKKPSPSRTAHFFRFLSFYAEQMGQLPHHSESAIRTALLKPKAPAARTR